MPPHNDPHDPPDHPAPSGSTGSSGSSGPTGSSVSTVPQTGATFSMDSSFSAVITETNAAQTVTGKINVIDPDAGQACLDLARTLGYSTASSYYKTGEATQTGSYYGSKTIFTLLDNNTQLAVISDGDPYPAKAGYTILTNDLSVEREWPLVPNPLTEQDFEYKFTYRGGNLNSDASYSNFFSGTSSMGVQGIFLNGVALYNPSSGSGTVPGTTISGNNTYNLNAVFFEQQYGIDESAGHPSPEGNDVNGSKGQMHYHDPMFLTSDIWNNETFAYSNTYFSSDYYTPASGNIDYIRHANGHSKIVGFCFDGYPIYGPYGYDGSFNSTSPSVLMTTSYRTKTSTFPERPYSYNDVVSGDGYSYTIGPGAFLDDYEYVPGRGSLDDCNGRFCVTPEYPNGTYAYFCLINEADEPVFPYILGKYSRQQRTVMNGGYPADSHNTDGSVIPTTGTAGEFNVSTLGVSKYVSAPINETIVDVSYGSFTIDSSGNWSYTMDGPHDEFVTDVSYNDSMRVYSYDGSANRLVTVTMMGTAEAPVGPTPTLLDENNADTQDLTYSLNSPAAGEATVSRYSGPDAAAIVIPAQVVSSDGTTTYNVVKIGDYIFMNRYISSITFNGNNLTSIGNAAFENCRMPAVTIPDSVTSIGDNVFQSCSALTAATIGNALTSIPWGTFSNCSALTTVALGNAIATITDNAINYSQLSSLTVGSGNTTFFNGPNNELYQIIESNSVSIVFVPSTAISFTIPSTYNGYSVTTIGTNAFNNRAQLTSVNVSASVTNIPSNAFNGCSLLTNVVIDAANTMYAAQDGIIYQKVDADNASVYMVFGTVTNVNIPATIVIGGGASIPVTSIPDSTFSNRSLTAVTIGANVTSIGQSAFQGCSELTAVTIPNAVTTIGSSAFSSCSKLTAVTIPNTVTSISGEAFYNCSELTAVTIGASVTTIDVGAFMYCVKLTAVIIGASVTSIGQLAFGVCSALTAVIIPDAVTSIGEEAFSACSELTAVTIGANVTTLGNGAFGGCIALTAVTIPASVTSIGYVAFSIATLKDVYFLGNNETTLYNDGQNHDFFGYGQFNNIASNAVAHYVATKTGWSVYNSSNLPAGFSNIQTFVPEGGSGGSLDANNADSQGVVYTLDSPAAGKATVSGKIESFTTTAVVIPSQVSRGGITYDVVSIVGAFNGASSLLSVNIPSSVTFIGLSAFEGCGNLVTVIGAQGVLSLGTSAFNNCSSLASAPIGSATSIPSFAFAGCVSLLSVTIPDSVTAIEMMAFFSCGGITLLTLGASVATIGHAAFDGCNAVRTVNVAANFTLFGILSSLPNLSTFNLPSNNTYIIQDKVVYQKVDATNATITKVFGTVTNVVIPDTIVIGGGEGIPVTSIPENIFSGRTSLTAVTIPDAVTSIGIGAFSGCALLTDLAIDSANATYVEQDGVVYQKVDSANAMVAFGLSSVTSANMPSSVSIGAASIPVTSIGQNAFNGSSALTAVTIGENVTSIVQYAFLSCSVLTVVTMGANVTSIGRSAFEGCIGLTAVTIPASVTYIDERAFYIASLKDVYFLGDNETASYYGQNYDFFGYGQFVQDRYENSTVSSIASNAVAYYVNGKSGWNGYSSDAPPAGFSDIQIFVPEGGSDSAPDHSSGPLTVADGDEIGNVSGGNVTVSSGTAAILSTGGTFALALNGGNADVTTLNGSVAASVSIGSGKSLSTSAGTFAGALSGAGTLKKNGSRYINPFWHQFRIFRCYTGYRRYLKSAECCLLR